MLPGPTIAAVSLLMVASENVIETVPIRSKVADTVSPGPNGIAAHTEPGRMTCPASRPTPSVPSVLASQTSALTGEPSTAPPAPVPSIRPFL